MTKSFSTVHLIHGKEPQLRRMACEIRYHDGQLYLDHCGRLLKQLTKSAPEWVVAPNPTPQGTTLLNLRTGTQLSFSMASASFDLDKTSADEVIDAEEAKEFVDQAAWSLGRIIDELEASDFTHLGYREHYYFACESKEESEEWIRGLGLFPVAPSLYQSFAAKPDALGVAVILEGSDCRYRIGLNGIERSAQLPVGEATLTVRASGTHKDQKKVLLEAMKKQRRRQINTAFAVVLDIDVFLVDPTEPELRSFMEDHSQATVKRFHEALPKDTGKKGR
jgi:hypothetical protein